MKELLAAVGLMTTPVELPDPTTLSVPQRIHKEVKCLADNIYFESRSESLAGQLAVAHVVMNRVEDPRFPNSICEVVYEGPHYKSQNGKLYPKKNRCQFSWYCDGLSDEIPKRHEKWSKRMEAVAWAVHEGEYKDITEGATHYHANYVHPSWAKVYTLTTTIDTHIFYRWEK